MKNGHILAASALFTLSGLASAQIPGQVPFRCGAPEANPFYDMILPPSDCAYGSTNPDPAYDPIEVWEIPVVFHVITRNNGTGDVTDQNIFEQIEILNEDFRALSGSNGANGNDSMIQFKLATVDPNGNPTSGITRTSNNTWYNDSGNFMPSLGWDQDRYLNIFTNSCSGYLGYVWDFPAAIAGDGYDGVVLLWSSVGANAPVGPPYNQGRTATHEVGHYLGLWHTFDNGCGTTSNCYSTGDAICDTNRQSSPTYGCPGNPSSCSSSDPHRNYMDYTDDICMWEFTPEQINRMRCSILYYRSNLYEVVGGGDGSGASNYCVSSSNSTGAAAIISYGGSLSISENDLSLYAGPMPTNQYGLYIFSANQAQASFGNGTR
ncbi:MAG: zinc metalloprotease, partial [Planctomycetes bacterium]|nr:zinc metalloprotease [Planctomycetota bacterium]